ncbi:polyprotein [Canna indica]|uniref:Polyprotein n=1 Tax=Canna indica TaxID=4628 RepID=A0AAQ3KRD3_9LILI|nr:polyprotein [Canna indica]
MEIDLTTGTQLAYTAPDITLSIHDFREHIQLVLQTHGYENWQGGESNLLLSRSLIGRLSNSSHTNFRYNVQHVADHLASRGIRAIPGQMHNTDRLQGLQWVIRPATIVSTNNPQSSSIRTRTDGSLAVQFGDYTNTTAISNNNILTNEQDLEELDREFVAMITCDDYNSDCDQEIISDWNSE